MRRNLVTPTLFLIIAASVSRFGWAAADVPPAWAYVSGGPGVAHTPDDGRPRRVPGSPAAFTLAQIRDAFNVPDWRTDDHPKMPEVVSRGRKPVVRACGYCHLPNGFGRPENSGLAGLPADYIAHQIADYRRNARRSSALRSAPSSVMAAIAKAATDADVEAAAVYFGSIPPKPWIRVVEVERVPTTTVAGGMLVPTDDGRTEPIGWRIVEVPEDRARAELRDPASGFVAYVPAGSLQRGKALVTTGGGGRTVRCGNCHGEDLKGLGSVPGIAGRSPSYQVRQLWDMQHGARNGLGSDLMKPTVGRLSEEDFVSIAAYTASRMP
jgi:cytochrome c553